MSGFALWASGFCAAGAMWNIVTDQYELGVILILLAILNLWLGIKD